LFFLFVDSHQLAVNPFAHLVRDQRYAKLSSVKLESGITLTDIPIAFKTWGTLNKSGTNVIVICHALSGSSDVEDWYDDQDVVTSQLQ